VIDDARYFEPVGGGTLRSLAGRARRIAWGARHQTSAVVRLPGASELIGGFAEDADTLGVAVQDSFDIGLKRTGRYLAWRYNAAWGDYHVTSLVQQGACRGYTVTKSDLGAGGKVTRILEFVARDDSPEAYDSLISVAAREARDAGSYYISVSSALSPGAIQRLRHFGFVRIESKARCVLYAYDDEVGRGLGGARFYQSLGDRDYL
jgi:hypothetical protein